jgi:hypothetical protein
VRNILPQNETVEKEMRVVSLQRNSALIYITIHFIFLEIPFFPSLIIGMIRLSRVGIKVLLGYWSTQSTEIRELLPAY